VLPVDAWAGGHAAAQRRLRQFCDVRLKTYERDRNRPELAGTSEMSPYLHFGHVSPVRIALEVERAAKVQGLKTARASFFNELVVWRELSVNFVRYSAAYDSVQCADNWARLTIAKHDRDERAAVYTRAQLERGETHDELWNAAQMQMVRGGWMHNFMRMYWGKKVIEWTRDAKSAMAVLIYLNDKYELDGRDANGYAGIAWAVLGKFDRAWGERPVWGKRRSMTYESTRRKFDATAYVRMVDGM
jgi:deoxyribodipyrimidine photo-lyase